MKCLFVASKWQKSSILRMNENRVCDGWHQVDWSLKCLLSMKNRSDIWQRVNNSNGSSRIDLAKLQWFDASALAAHRLIRWLTANWWMHNFYVVFLSSLVSRLFFVVPLVRCDRPRGIRFHRFQPVHSIMQFIDAVSMSGISHFDFMSQECLLHISSIGYRWLNRIAKWMWVSLIKGRTWRWFQNQIQHSQLK